MKLNKNNKDTQSAIRKALTAGATLGSLLVGLSAQSNAAQEHACVAPGGDEPATTNTVNEAKANRPIVMGKMLVTPRPLAGRHLAGEPLRELPVPEGKYRVRNGDTLTKIASLHKTTVEELKRLNGFDDERANRIKAGEVIKIAEPKK